MIKLNLGIEPIELTNERNIQLPLAIAAFNLHGQDHKDFKEILDKGYRSAAIDTLYVRQHKKCAFCESFEEKAFRPVEHFRPKKKAQNKVNDKWESVSTHYWWLAWTWDNLFFSCQSCNMSGKKGNKFPIRPGSSRIAAPARPIIGTIPVNHYNCTLEQSLLVDPRVDDPFDHLQWTPLDRRLNKAAWKWTIEGRDDRGDMTIEVMSLTDRIDIVNRHLNALRALWIELDEHISEGRGPSAVRCWDNLVANFIDDPLQPFRNAAWWAADSLCSKPYRTRHGLRHPIRPVG